MDSGLVLASSGVSRTHASFYLHGDGVVISDEGSANGVKVDGALINAPTLIDHTNRLQISSYVLSLEPEEAEGVVPAPAEVAADTDEQVLDHDTRLEAHSGAGSALASSMLELVGRGGPYGGTRVALESLLMTVGRVEANDLMLDDPSVSRRHAQLRVSVTGDRVTVLDLRSHNGTYVDGERLKRGDAGIGSVIRFGDISFKLEKRRLGGARPGRRRGGLSGRQRLIAAIGALVLILLAVGVVAYRNRPKPVKPAPTPVIGILQARQAKIQALVEQARRKVALREWSRAEEQLRVVLEKDPLNVEARRLMATTEAERRNQRTYQDGMKYYALGNRENLIKARGVFERLPKNSVYQREVRYRLKNIAEKVAEEFRIEGVSRCRARYWRRCQQALCRFFSLLSEEAQVPGEPGLRRLLQGAERRLRRRRDFEPCEVKRYRSPPSGIERGQDAAALLAQRYPDLPAVYGVLKVYIGGNLDGALHRLSRLRSKRRMRPHTAQLSEINRQLLVIRGKYQEGYSAYRERKADEADRQWNVLLSAEASLLPEGIDSFHRREVLRMLGDLYFELGEEQDKAKRFRAAARYWHRGHALNKNHARLLNGILQLEKTATSLIGEGRRLAAAGQIRAARQKLTMGRDICKPGSSTRATAEKALGALGQ